MARDSTRPLWAARLSPRAESLAVAPGDVTAGAVSFRGGSADLFAPISPGVRQLAVTYLLDADAFPLSVPAERAIAVLEVLVEEPRARVDGAGLAETDPAEIEGRRFRRFMARDVPASAVVRVDVPVGAGQRRSAMQVLAAVMALAMAGALVHWARGRRRRPFDVPAPSALLIGELAALDVRFERDAGASAEARANYERSRAELKERIANALAAESGRL